MADSDGFESADEEGPPAVPVEQDQDEGVLVEKESGETHVEQTRGSCLFAFYRNKVRCY